MFGPSIPLANLGHPLNQRLVGWWMLHPSQGGGGLMPDLSGRGNHGVLTSGPTWGGSSSADGTVPISVTGGSYIADTVALPWNVDIPTANAFTVIFWMWNSAYSSYECLFEVSKGTTGSDRIASIFVEATTSMYTAIKGAGGNPITLSPLLTTSEWQRIGFSFDGTTVRIWRNGVQSGSSTSAAVIGSTWGSGGNQDTWGLNRTTGGTNASALFASRLTFSRALSAAEMMQEYNEAKAGFPTMLNRPRRNWVKAAAAAAGGGAGMIFSGSALSGRCFGGRALA